MAMLSMDEFMELKIALLYNLYGIATTTNLPVCKATPEEH